MSRLEGQDAKIALAKPQNLFGAFLGSLTALKLDGARGGEGF